MESIEKQMVMLTRAMKLRVNFKHVCDAPEAKRANVRRGCWGMQIYQFSAPVHSSALHACTVIVQTNAT